MLNGTYYLEAPLRLTVEDSFTTLSGAPHAILSGGYRLNVSSWRQIQGQIYATQVDLGNHTVTRATSLFVNGRRAIPARFPNGDPGAVVLLLRTSLLLEGEGAAWWVF